MVNPRTTTRVADVDIHVTAAGFSMTEFPVSSRRHQNDSGTLLVY